MNSIEQRYEERKDKTEFKIDWEKDDNNNPINPSNFKEEIKEFVKGFQRDEEVTSLEFYYCPFEVLKSDFLRFIISFPVVKRFKYFVLFW
eukprot:snap_masked-scaffold_4-processed-gene-8.20-mRNA-1 protein AED:1.00 eAED:1.00 QI:0/0/0/0/1/1/3/0/89